MKPRALLLLFSWVLPACADSAAPAASGPAAMGAEEAVRQMNAAIDALMARPEHQAAEVTVQHILVGVTHPRLAGVQRSPGEAEQLAAELWARIRADEDFETLMKNHSNDSSPSGIYTLSAGEGNLAAGIYARAGMVPAFGDVGWRLELGEVGVARQDATRSPFGYHIIKRLK